MKRPILTAIAATLLITGTTGAQETQFGVQWDAEAVSKMTREDRLVYQREYKNALEAAARQAGAIPKKRNAGSAGRVAQLARVPGTMISYHSGALSVAPVNSVSVGNQFDTALTTMGGLGPVEMSGSITMFTADMATVAGGAAFFSVFDQLVGTTANVVSSTNVPMVTGFNSVTLASPLNYVGSSFLAGVWNFTGDSVNVASATVSGQGFHGMSINDIAATGFNPFPSTNGTVGVGGNVQTPVELMSFQIE